MENNDDKKQIGVSKPCGKLFLIGLIVLLTFLPMISAGITDRVVYEKEDLTFEVKSYWGFFEWLGIDQTVMKGELISHKSVDEIKQVGLGWQRVMEYELEAPKENLGNIIGEINFIDGKTGKATEKPHYLVYKFTEERQREVCVDWEVIDNTTIIKGDLKEPVNETVEPKCLRYENQTYEFVEWRNYTSKDLMKGNITLGLMVYNEQGDYLDGVWSFSGKEITKHAYWDASLDTGLVSYYKLDETSGTNAEDSAGDNDGTARNSRVFTTEVDGIIETGADFTGGDDYIDLVGFIPNHTANFAISFWMKRNGNPSGDEGLLGNSKHGVTNAGVVAQMRTNGKIFIRSGGGGGQSVLGTTTLPYSNNTWYHLTIVHDNTLGKGWLYIDGTQVLYADWNPAISDTAFQLGRSRNTAAIYFGGYLDEVAIYNRSLSEEEISILYGDGDPPCFECYGPVILISPENDFESDNLDVNFSCNASWETANLVSLELFINGSSYEEVTDAGDTFLELSSTETLSDGSWSWYCNATDNDSVVYQSDVRSLTIDTTPFIEFLTPPTLENATNWTETYIPVGVNVSTPHFSNITYNLYNSEGVYQTQTFTNETFEYNFTNCLCDNYEYNVTVCTTTDKCNTTETRTLIIDALDPVIEINAGNGTQDYGVLTQNHTINFTATDDNLDSCWINYNGTNRSVSCSNGTEASGNFILVKDLYTATIYANDTFGNTASEIVEWDYKIFENEQVYEEEVYETASTNIAINVTYNSSIPTTALLNYNGTNYSSVNSGSGSIGYFSSDNFNAPLVNSSTNYTFYWIFNVNGTIIETASLNQTVNPLIFSQCNGTINVTSLNFTFFEETDQININASNNATTIKTTFYYWVGDGSVKKEYSFQNLSSSLNNYQFCLDTNTTFQIDLDMQYSAEGYPERTYYFRNETISNETRNILLYLLDTSKAVKFDIEIKEDISPFTDAIVEIWKYFVGQGQYKKVMVGLTDNKGLFPAQLDLDQTYDLRVYRDGVNYGNFTKLSMCSATPCEISLNVESVNITAFEDYYNYFAQNIDYELTYNTTSRMIYLTFEDNLETAQYWRLFVYQISLSNDSITTICDTSSYSTSGTITCSYAGYTGNNIYAKVFISRSPEKLVEIINLIESVPAIIGISVLLASIVIILVIVFAGTRNPVIALVLLIFAVIILKLMDFMPFSWIWIAGFVAFIFWIITRLKT